MDTKFSVALHLLAMISESKKILSSQSLAESVGTNASYVRKVIALLKNANLIVSHQGRSGYRLNKSAKEMTLLEIYCATQEVEHIQLFQMHQHANKDCPVGEHIENAMGAIFSKIALQLEVELKHQTLDAVIANLYTLAKQKRDNLERSIRD